MAPEVLEIVEVNQTNENFCVIFTLVFTYVDPTLSSKWRIFSSPTEAEKIVLSSGGVCKISSFLLELQVVPFFFGGGAQKDFENNVSQHGLLGKG